jgi:hypothetical protein
MMLSSGDAGSTEGGVMQRCTDQRLRTGPSGRPVIPPEVEEILLAIHTGGAFRDRRDARPTLAADLPAAIT